MIYSQNSRNDKRWNGEPKWIEALRVAVPHNFRTNIPVATPPRSRRLFLAFSAFAPLTAHTLSLSPELGALRTSHHISQTFCTWFNVAAHRQKSKECSTYQPTCQVPSFLFWTRFDLLRLPIFQQLMALQFAIVIRRCSCRVYTEINEYFFTSFTSKNRTIKGFLVETLFAIPTFQCPLNSNRLLFLELKGNLCRIFISF